MAEAWRRLPALSEADLDRVAAFLRTERARRHHVSLIAFERELRAALPGFDWTAVDVAALLGLIVVAAGVIDTRDNGFPSGTAADLTARSLTIFYRLILAAEDAGLPPLVLAQRAITAILGSPGAVEELARRTDPHLGHIGFSAAAAALLRVTDPDVDGLRRLRTLVANKMPETWRTRRSLTEQREDIDGAVTEEIVRRLRGRYNEPGLLDATLEALPPGQGTVSAWDYVARDAAQRLRREEAKRSDIKDPTASRPRAERPDLEAARLELIARCRANPRSAAALEAIMSRATRPEIAHKYDISVRTLQTEVRKLLRTFADFARE